MILLGAFSSCGFRRLLCAVLLLGGGAAVARAGPSAGPSAGLTIGRGAHAAQETADTLLHRPDVRTLDLSASASPLGSLGAQVRAVPLTALVALDGGVEAVAHDAFVAVIPAAVFARARRLGVTPYVAIETSPWPKERQEDSGPFALVWSGAQAGRIARERWVFELAALRPAVSAALPRGQTEVAERGRAAFATSCLPCHRLDGVGSGRMGPDLGAPVSVTAYVTHRGFRAIVRQPAAVRHWPGQKMEPFPKAVLPDADLEAIWVYLSTFPDRHDLPSVSGATDRTER